MRMRLSLLVVLSAAVLAGCSPSAADPTPSLSPSPSPVVAEPSIPPVLETGVVLQIPEENSTVSNSFPIEGLAPGTWFFEGQIVGEVISESGETLATFPLMAEGEWMTEEHVRFEGRATFIYPEGDETIQLVIKNDNPSGLPENDKSESFTLRLEK